MKPMSNMDKGELIEAVAAVSFRVMAATHVFSAFYGIVLALSNACINAYFQAGNSYSNHPPNFGLRFSEGVLVILNLLMAALYFCFAVSLARLVSRGLCMALEPKRN